MTTATASRTGGSGWTTSQGPGDGVARHRAWITDLHTGRTESSVLNSLDYLCPRRGSFRRRGRRHLLRHLLSGRADRAARDAPCSGSALASLDGGSGARSCSADGGGDSTNGGGTHRGAMPARFYVWASVIVDGRVVATDYAPDFGWLHPSSKEPPSRISRTRSTPPIDSLEEALAAVGQTDNLLSASRRATRMSPAHRPGSKRGAG